MKRSAPRLDDNVTTIILSHTPDELNDADDDCTVIISRTPAQNLYDEQYDNTIIISNSDKAAMYNGDSKNSADAVLHELDLSEICFACFKHKGNSEICVYCNAKASASPEQAYHLHPGCKLDERYIIGTVIGFGGFGITYSSWDEILGMVVAIKEFFPARLVSRIPGEMRVASFSGEKETQYSDQLARYLDEARNLAKCSECPHIVKVFRYFDANNTAYIVMEYLDGLTLKDYAQNEDGIQKALEMEEALRIFETMTHALELIHSKGIIHRDVSPDNIFIKTDGQVKLLDFGAARLSQADKDATSAAVVKPGYAPPEQYRSKSIQGPFTDVYGLGATLYRMLTGVTPSESSDRAVGEDCLQKPSQMGIKIKSNLEKAVLTAMAVDSDLRFRSMKEFRQAVLGNKKIAAPEEKKRRRQRFRRIVTTVAALMLVLSIAAFGIYMNFKPAPLSETALSPDTITVLIPTGIETNFNKEIMDDLVNKFCEQHPGISIQLETADVKIYEEKLNQAYADKKMPTLFFTENISFDTTKTTVPLDDVINALNPESYFFVDRYADMYPHKKEIPLSYEVSTVYANKHAADYNQVLLPKEITDLNTLKAGVQWDIANDCNSSYFALFGKFSGGTLDEQKTAEAVDSLLQIRSAESADGSTLSPIERLQNNSLTYLFASTNNLSEISQKMSGYYTLLPVTLDGTYYGTFHDTWSVSSAATKNQKNIAKLFLIYMLSSYVQEQLYIENESWIPVNGEAFSTYLNVYSELSFLQSNLSDIKFLGEREKDFNTIMRQFEETLNSSTSATSDTLRAELTEILLKYKN